MSNNSKIQWTDHTWNMVWGCNGGCTYCYARKIAGRYGGQIAKKEINHRYSTNLNTLTEEISSFRPTLLLSQIRPKFPKKTSLIFSNSMSDIASWKNLWLKELVRIIKENPKHVFQILTKFPKLIQAKFLANDLEWPENVWFGLTVTNQKDFNYRFNYFIEIPATLRFLSIEPMIDRVQISKDQLSKLDWIIIGCMSGPGRTRIDNQIIVDLVKSIKDMNPTFPIFVKQVEYMGKIIKDNLPSKIDFREFPKF